MKIKPEQLIVLRQIALNSAQTISDQNTLLGNAQKIYEWLAFIETKGEPVAD